MANATAHFFWSLPPGGPGEGPKGQIALNFNYTSISNIFKPNFVCHKLKIQNILDGIFIMSPGSHPRGDAGGQNLIFLSMVNWHIKLKGMISRPGYNEKFTLGPNWWPKVKYHLISSRV